MCSEKNLHPIFFSDEFFKMLQIGARRVTNQEAGCKVNMRHPVFFHLFGSILYVASWTASASCESSKFHLLILVYWKSPFTIFQWSETLSSGTGMIPVAYDYSDFNFWLITIVHHAIVWHSQSLSSHEKRHEYIVFYSTVSRWNCMQRALPQYADQTRFDLQEVWRNQPFLVGM